MADKLDNAPTLARQERVKGSQVINSLHVASGSPHSSACVVAMTGGGLRRRYISYNDKMQTFRYASHASFIFQSDLSEVVAPLL